MKKGNTFHSIPKLKIIGPNDDWNPWLTQDSRSPTLLTAPFGKIIPSPPLLIHTPSDGFLELGHIMHDAQLRKAQLGMMLESALYHPLPRHWKKLDHTLRVALLDQPRDTSDWFGSIDFLLNQGWQVITPSHLPQQIKRRFQQHRRFVALPSSESASTLPLIRNSNLIVGGTGPIARVAAFLGKPLLWVSSNTNQPKPAEDFHEQGIAASDELKQILLKGYPLDTITENLHISPPRFFTLAGHIHLPGANSDTPDHDKWPASQTSNQICNVRKNREKNGETMEIQGNVGRYHKEIDKFGRKLRKLSNDPKAFLLDAKNPLFREIGKRWPQTL